MAMTVEDLYREILGREPDPEGLAFWKAGFGDDVSPEERASFMQAAAPELAGSTPPASGLAAWLQATPNPTDTELRNAMGEFGVSPAQMAKATGLPEGNIVSRIAATLGPGETANLGGVFIQPVYSSRGDGETFEQGPLSEILVYKEGQQTGDTYAKFSPSGEEVGAGNFKDPGLGNILNSVITDLGPIGQIGLAIATGGLSIPQQIAAQMAIQILSGKNIEDAVKSAAISFAVAQIPGIDAVKEGTSYLNTIDTSGVLGKAFSSAASSAAKAVLTGQDISDALLSGAVAGGTAGAVDFMASGVEGFKDLTPAQQKMAKDAITGVISGKPLDQVLINSAIAAASAEIKTAANNDKAKKDGWTDYATQQAAKLAYGPATTPEVYANKQETTVDEAKDIARGILGREPTEFEYMQLVGLPENTAAQNEDLAGIRYNEGTFDSGELAQAYKDVYGKEPTEEWLASDEAIDMLGRSDAQGKNMLQNAYIQDKNTTSNTEAEAIWKAQGNTGPIPEDVLFSMLSTSEDASRAMSETYRITAEDRAATTFDASGFDDPRAAADAAKKAGYNTFSMADGGTFTVLTPAKEGEIKDEIAKKASFGDAFADARQRLGLGKTFEWEGKLYTTDYAPTNKAVPFDGSKAASKEDAAKLAVANGKLSFTYDGKTYGMDMQAASIIANSQNQSAAETNRLLAQAIKPATNESLAETQRLVAAGKPGIMDTVNSMTAQALGTTQRGLGQFVENMGNTYAQMTGDTSYSNAMTKAGKEIQDYAKGNDIYGLDVQKDRVMQAVKLSEESPNFFDKVAIIGAAMAKNPLGAFDIVGSEAVEEIPETIAQIGVALLSGGTSLSVTAGKTIIGGISIAGSFIESFGASGKEAYTLSKARGDSDEVALNKSYVNATLGTLAEIPGDLLADKALVGPLMKNFAEKTLTSIGAGLVTNATAGAVSELVSGALQSYSTQMVVDPTTASWSKAVSNGVFEMFIGSAVQTAMATPGAVVDTARVIGRDYSGNDVTLQQVLDGGASLDLGSVSSGTELAVIPGGGTITVGSSISSGVDLGVDYSVALNVLPENLTGAGTVVAYDEDGTPVTLGELLDARAKDGDRGLYTDYLSDIFANPTPVTDQGASAPPDGVTDVVDKTPALTDQTSSMKSAFETELAKAISQGYRNEDAIKEAVGRVSGELGLPAEAVLGTIGKTQDQLFADYLDQVNVAPAEPEAPVTPPAKPPETPPTAPPATGGEVVAVDPDSGTALVVDGNGNTSVVDNSDGALVPGDAVPVAPPAAPEVPATQPVTPPATGGEVVAVDPDSGTALVADGSGNTNVVDNTDGSLNVGDTVPATPTSPVTPVAPVTPPTQTQPETGGGTQTGGVDFADPTDNVVDPTLDDLLSGIGAEGSATPNLPAVIPPTTPATPTGPDVSNQLADVETRLSDAIQAAEAMGLTRDQAIAAAVESVASELGTTKASLLSQLGTTEAALRNDLTTGLAGVSAEVQSVYNSLSADQKSLANQLTQQGVDLSTAIQQVQSQTSSQIGSLSADMQAKYDALTASQKAAADALVAQGQTFQNAIQQAQTQTQGQIGNLAADMQAKYDSLTAAQKAAADALVAQGQSLQQAIAEAQTQTQGQIGALSADVQAKYDALTTEQRALANDIAQQGVDLTTAINLAQQQTQAQISGLGQQVDTRINQLMQQGQTYQQATQQAINELSQRNTELSGLIGTQSRAVTQADIDALTRMVGGNGGNGGNGPVDLSYDVNGDNQITQADIDFLTGVVNKTNTDWEPPIGSAWGPTGLYGEIARNEAQRQADIAAQNTLYQQAELKRQQDAAAAELKRQEELKQQQQQQKVTTAMQGTQSLMSMVPQMYKAAEETSTPLYAAMDYYDPFGDPFGQTKVRPASATKPTDQTKMAQGGYLGDLLAENMSVDDLLNLLH